MLACLFVLSALSGLGQQLSDFDHWHQRFFAVVWNDRDSANFYLEQIGNRAQSSGKNTDLKIYSSCKGTYFYSLGLYDLASGHYAQAYDYAKKDKDKLFMGKSLNNIANCHYEEHDYERAKEYYEKAGAIFKEIGDETWVNNVQFNTANVLHDLGDYHQAIKLYHELEERYMQNNSITEAGYCNFGLGSSLYPIGDTKNAISNFKIALQRVDTLNDSYTHSMILNKLSLALLDNGDLSEARYTASRALKIASAIDYKKQVYKNLWGLAKIHHQLGEHDASIGYYERALAYKDTVFDEEKQAQYALNNVRFETELNLETIRLQEELIEEKNRVITYLITGSLVLIFLLTLLIWTFLNLRKNRAQLQKSVIEKDALLREIHHRVKNNLQVVTSLLNMHVRKVTDPHSKKILEEGADRVMAMAIIHKNLYQHTDLKTISLDEYLDNLCNQLFANYKPSDKQVILEKQLQKIDVDVDRLIPIGLIVNELISNAMKHAFDQTEQAEQAEIQVRLSLSKRNHIELEVSDNGKGMQSSVDIEKSDSIGMKLIRIFSQKLNSLIEITNDNGTHVKLTIPTN